MLRSTDASQELIFRLIVTPPHPTGGSSRSPDCRHRRALGVAPAAAGLCPVCKLRAGSQGVCAATRPPAGGVAFPADTGVTEVP